MSGIKGFRFEFLDALQSLADCDIRCKNELGYFLQLTSWTFQEKQNLLQRLAELSIRQDFVPLLVKHCRPILLEVLERAAQILQQGPEENKEGFCYTLSTLLPLSHLKDFIYRFIKSCSVFSELFKAEEYTEKSNERILCALRTGYNLLCYDFEIFYSIWDWSPVFNLLQHRNPDVRWLAVNIVAVITEMSEQIKLGLLDNCISIEERNKFTISEWLTRSPSNLIQQCMEWKDPSSVAADFMDVDSRSHEGSVITEEDLVGSYVTICGVMLPRLPGTFNLSDKLLVMVPSTVNNLRSLVLSVASGTGVLLEGPIGSGKTALVEYVAKATGRSSSPEFMKIQLGDQTDSKSLLGTYVCTDTPGEFAWQPGPLLQAVQSGYWILLEDIDLAPMDVVSVLIPLLESRTLSVPAHGNSVKASPGFQLFATQRSYTSPGGISYQVTSASSAVLDKLWTRVQIEPLSKHELTDVLKNKYPDLEAVASKLVDIYCLLSADPKLISNHDTSSFSLPHDKRLSSTRDFMKWCSRIALMACGTPSLLDSTDVFLEAQDCFSAPLPKMEDRNVLDMAVGAKLGLTKEKIEFLSRSYKPKVHTSPLSLTVGRVTLKRNVKESKPIRSSRKTLPRYAHTRHSLVLLEKVAACIRNNEPVLLVGETGTGKTSTVQYLSAQCAATLKVVNMSQQSDSSDLLGGYKPVEIKQIVAPVREKFEELFCKTFSRKQNVKFLCHIQKCFAQGMWEMLFKLMMHCQKNALERAKKDEQMKHLLSDWERLNQDIQQLRKQKKNAESALAFRFVEGALVQALRNGDWVLLDEINLATPETLECLCGLLESSSGSLVLMEKGDATPITRHEDFRLFACMNPATDVGKKDLPPGIRNRFTEIFVKELEDVGDLKTLVVEYLQGLSPNAAIVDGIVRFYNTVKQETNDKLTDGTGHKPHYSLRTLCRALRYAAGNPHQNALRSIYEGFCLSFLTQLDRSSHPAVQSLIKLHLLGHVNAASLLKQPLPNPQGSGQFSNFEGFWIAMGNKEPVVSADYVLTASVKANLKDLSRVVSARKLPVLIQGETSVGKTSLIQWLAKATGNHCVRINNHEHTDIQEYLGCYTSDVNGKLVFQEGVLVDAMRKGHWIILDELNLAPTDVLEALNRLLDDNRELFIPETQDTVVAHPMFMLFATQNPPGHYGGRKVLSRAFRNRFVELHFDELPSQELEVILHQRCSLPLSYAKKLVAIMLDLQARRRSTNVFAGKQGFITLRDLFRWATRYSKTPDVQGGVFHDWDLHLAEDGYMLLAGRCRNPSECKVVQEVIERHLKRQLDPDLLFGDPSVLKHSPGVSSLLTQVTTASVDGFSHIVWTRSMRRLAVLAGRALQFGEPVLLVGETGCGKTTICQLFAALWFQTLFAVNCHMHSESSDFLGGLRPVRNRGQEEKGEQLSKLFEWCDGPLVQAMKTGAMLLVDEISLADDSVLERLNSVLEPERTLLLAEKGGSGLTSGEDVDVLVAHEDFKIIATMNPGGDFGKKELSPALRNRFTEIWCPPSNARADLIQIIEHNIKPGVVLKSASHESSGVGEAILDFIEWFHSTDFGKRFVVSTRDLLSWVNFINTCSASTTSDGIDDNSNDKVLLSPAQAYVHGACLVFLDALGSGMTSFSPSSSSSSGALKDAYQACYEFLRRQVDLKEETHGRSWGPEVDKDGNSNYRPDYFGVSPFFIPRGPLPPPEHFSSTYALNSPTTSLNAQRLLRALQLPRPILLEGSPGVGKTSLVGAIAKASGNELIRINLSEQTDVTDLFGADLPVEGGEAGQFVWRDGPLLKALRAGHWIVLDELNLASQSVLEGLNACLDHRGEIYIPELGMTFKVQRGKTRLFACQNPLNQGGGRKGLPKSFLNRFTQVFVEPLSKSDLLFITGALYPEIDPAILDQMVTFNMKIHEETVVEARWGRKGSPWELNLRDVFRWCDLLIKHQFPGCWDPAQFLRLIYCDRMRTVKDKQMVLELYKSVTMSSEPIGDIQLTRPSFFITPSHVQVGHSWLPRCPSVDQSNITGRSLQVLHHCLPAMESLMKCLEMNWMAILVGPRSCGKTSLVHLVSQLTGNKLEVMAMNSAMDTTELLGGFEQADLNRQWGEILKRAKEFLLGLIRDLLIRSKDNPSCLQEASSAYKLWMASFNNDSEGSDDTRNDILIPEKLIALQTMTAAMKDICDRNSISSASSDTLLEMLQSLKSRLQANGESCHCGGQFEWVDGQLVEALKSGYWLLIDNVNFCSPSVLDRLNALLEPGGVLTIDERGAIDGSIPSIKPHPNFRLILAMDPRYGEISRAMRNRGVEIFMLGEEDGDVFDDYDHQMMLHGLGLQNTTTCDSLVAFHKRFKHTLGGSVLDLLHSASLTVQLLLRGSDLQEAVLTSLMQVYARNQSSEHNKQVAEELIRRHISSSAHSENETHSNLIPECFPSAQAYHTNSVVSTVILHSLPLLRILRNNNSVLQLEVAVLLFLERSSVYDWKLRLDYLQSVMDVFFSEGSVQCVDVTTTIKSFLQSFGSVFVSDLMKNLKNEMKNLKFTRFNSQMLDHLPFDLRLNTDLFNHLKQSSENSSVLDKASGFSNRLSSLESEVRRRCHEVCPTELPARNLIQLSRSFHSGQLQQESLPHPVVVHLLPLFELLSSFLEKAICQVESLDDNHYWMVTDGLEWSDRLHKICEKQTSQTFSISAISLHWSWVVQNTINTLTKAFSVEQLPSDLLTVVNHLNSILGVDSRLAEVNLTILAAYGHPAPFKSKLSYQIWEKLWRLCQRIDSCQKKKQGDEIEEKLHEAKRKLTEAIVDMLTKKIEVKEDLQFDSLLTNLEKNKVFAEDVTSPSEDSAELEMDLERNTVTSHVRMKRVLLAMFDELYGWQEHVVLGTLMSGLANQMACRENFQKADVVEEKLKAITTYRMKKKTSWNPETQAHYQHLWRALPTEDHFITHFYPVESKLLCNYFMCRSHILWMQNSQEKCSLTEQGVDEKESRVHGLLGGVQSLLHNMASRNFVAETHSPLSSLTVRNYHENIHQLQMLSKHLWVNGDFLDNHYKVEQKSSTELLQSKFIQVLLSLKEILPPNHQQSLVDAVKSFVDAIEHDNKVMNVIDGVESAIINAVDSYKQTTGHITQADLISTLFNECLEGIAALQDRPSEDAHEMLWNAICLGILWVKLGLIHSLLLCPVGTVDPVEKISVELQHVNDTIVRIEEELKVRYDAEEMWTGFKTDIENLESLFAKEALSTSQLTSNPCRVWWLLKKLKDLKEQRHALEKNSAFRPTVSQFEAIIAEVRHYMQTVGDTNSIISLLDPMRELASQLFTCLKEGAGEGVSTVYTAIHKAKAWYTSAKRFVQHLMKEYPLYCDLLLPFVAGICQVIYGMSLISARLSTLNDECKFWVQFPLNVKSKISGPGEALATLCYSPTSRSSSPLDAAVSLMSPSVQGCVQALVKYLQDDKMSASVSAHLSYRILRLCLLLVRNHSIQQGFVDVKIRRALNSILKVFLEKWRIFKEKEKEREDEEGSLFKFKNKSHGPSLSEDEENKQAVSKAFPSFDRDFKDIMASQDLNETGSIAEEEVEPSQHSPVSDVELFMANMTDFSEITKVHEEMYCRLPSNREVCVERKDFFFQDSVDALYLEALQWSYRTSAIVNTIIPWSPVGDQLSWSHLLQSCILKGDFQAQNSIKQQQRHSLNAPSGGGESIPFNIYHDSNIQEVVKVKPILQDFIARVEGLLAEWPRHPTLLQLVEVTERILSFPVTSPVMKILTGLEVLLRKAQDWESNAAKHVSLKDHLDSVTQLIIEWRKMELKCWSSLLDVATVKSATKASQWWFHIYNSLEQFRADVPPQEITGVDHSASELIQPFQRFIESSTLGEFTSRVQMLFTFYKEMCNEEGRTSTLEVKASDVLWNLYSYYKQFIPCIEQSLQEARKPIEKELKDFVKIAKWNDSNFWAMKQAADKSHHTLHKFVRKYESSLDQPVEKTLMNVKKILSSSEDNKLQTSEQKTLKAEWFTSPDHLKVYCNRSLHVLPMYEAIGVCLPSTQTRLSKLFQKMRQHSEQMLCQRHYMLAVTALDDFTGEVITSSNELQTLDVSSQPKEKRAELSKHIQQRKRKSLSDLFKMLASLGVSYRKGLTLERQCTGKEAMLLAAVDEEAITRSFTLLSDRSPDLLHKVRNLLDGCCHHYHKALARSAAFSAAMITPSKELSVGDIDRCKGCSHHLLNICYQQRKFIAQFSQHITSASVCLNQLVESVGLADDDIDSTRTFLPPQTKLQERTVRVMGLLTHTAHVLQHMSLLIKCCPSDVSLQEWTPLPKTMLSPLALSSSDDPLVTDVSKTLEDSVTKVQQLIQHVRPYAAVSDNMVNSTSRDEMTTFIASWRQFRVVSDVFIKLEGIAEVINEMLPKFASKCCDIEKGLGGSLVDLKNEIRGECNEFNTWRLKTLAERGRDGTNRVSFNKEVMVTVDTFLKELDAVNTSLLLGIQKLAKIAESRSSENTQEQETADSDADVGSMELLDGHLTMRLHRDLLEEINCLGLEKVMKSISDLMSQLKNMADCTGLASNAPDQLPSISLCAQLFGTTIPLLHQYLNISQHFLVNLLAAHRVTSKLLSVLLSIFTDLVSKGFCLPPEIEEGEADGATEFEDIEGGGIGEGEGMKDVSDQIESEDQLEDAKQEGQEQDTKEEQQQQIPDEENGIEMSENFDGALHDVEAGDNEENEKSDEENEDEPDVDKQMGEVDGQETEKLDEKMWGDSDDEEEQEEKETKEEKGSGAEAESQSQLVAKEDNKGSTDESKEKADQEPNTKDEQDNETFNNAQDDEEGNMSDEAERDEEGKGQQEQQAMQDMEEESANLDLPDDLQLDEEGNERNDGQQEEMETSDFEGEEADATEPEDESTEQGDEEMDEKGEQGETKMEDEENIDGKDKQEDGENSKDEEADVEDDEDDWRTKADTKSQPQDNVQAVEDSGEGDGSGEQTDITAGQSESTDGSEDRGVGRAEAANDEGHHGESSAVQASADTSQQSRQRKQMNRARSDRRLGSMDETTHKRLKTVDTTQQESGTETNETRSQDLFQHMQSDDSSTHDAQTLDSATADQAKEQEKANFPDTYSDTEDDDTEMKTALFDDKEELPAPDNPQQTRLRPPNKPKVDAVGNEDEQEVAERATKDEDMQTIEGGEISTERLQSTFHSSEVALAFERLGISSLDPEKLRLDLEHQLAEWTSLERGTAEEQRIAQETWRKYEVLTSSLSQELCEQLRLVLEPSLATKLKGDYRSGKRLNMRKVIPYIASQFRKDKIWLRRTKPSKRQYQIMLAVDDSSSMNDNHSKQLAFESLAVISNALTRLEAGDLGVCSFGETVRLLHPFHEPFTDQSGAKILQQFTFDQKKTKIAQLLDTCTSLMVSAHSRLQVSPRMRRDTSQLLLIVSDGRGIFLEGMETVQKAVRVAREANIFMVFVILDNPTNKDSVLDIRVPIFRPGKPPEIKSYMEQFPFPFYIILRDINALPLTLSDALRQWFELVSCLE